MNGIKMSDCRFYVNEDERTVVCVIPKTQDMLVDFIKDHYSFADLDFYFALSYKKLDELQLPNAFIGKAVCSEEDEWNEETGKLIAFSRAKDKCYRSFFKRANNFAQSIDRRLGDMIDCFNEFGIKLQNKQNDLEDRINAMVGGNKKEGDA